MLNYHCKRNGQLYIVFWDSSSELCYKFSTVFSKEILTHFFFWGKIKVNGSREMLVFSFYNWIGQRKHWRQSMAFRQSGLQRSQRDWSNLFHPSEGPRCNSRGRRSHASLGQWHDAGGGCITFQESSAAVLCLDSQVMLNLVLYLQTLTFKDNWKRRGFPFL